MASQDEEQNGLMGRVDEGVDEFFSKKVTKSVRIHLQVYRQKHVDNVTAHGA